MKFIFLCAGMLCSWASFSQDLSDTAAMAFPPPALAFSSVSHTQTASLGPIRHAGFSADNEGPGQCRKYHNMKLAGTIMTAVGGGVFAIGLTMVFIGSDDASYYGVTTASDQAEILGGAVMMGTGAGCLVSGVTLLCIGHAKAKQYCGDKDSRYREGRGRGRGSYHRSYRSRSYMELKTNCRGLALNF